MKRFSLESAHRLSLNCPITIIIVHPLLPPKWAQNAIFPALAPSKFLHAMHDPLKQARELAARWREANFSSGGVVILLDGEFVGHAAELPPAAQWAPGCLAVAATGPVRFVRPAGFRGEVEWFELPEDSEESAPESPPLPS